MTVMVLATLFIVGFITVVLLMVNWSLMKQKLLLQTNVDFFNNMAHEFRTPFSSIGLAVNRLTKKHEDLRENPFLAVIKRENTQLLQEVERVLHLAKIENGEYILEKEKLYRISYSCFDRQFVDVYFRKKCSNYLEGFRKICV
jgi:signal transduction histidine kinase